MPCLSWQRIIVTRMLHFKVFERGYYILVMCCLCARCVRWAKRGKPPVDFGRAKFHCGGYKVCGGLSPLTPWRNFRDEIFAMESEIMVQYTA